MLSAASTAFRIPAGIMKSEAHAALSSPFPISAGPKSG